MKTVNIVSLAAALTASVTLSAQIEGGSIVRASDFAITDMLQLSQYDYSFGTARSAAMGGAFSSLGADMVSLSQNPAGLGMYRGSEISFSPGITWSRTASTSPGPYQKGVDDNYTRFAPGSIGVALNTFQSTGALTSFTFGFGYTKLADYNHNTSIRLGQLNRSILDVFATQLTASGITTHRLDDDPWYDNGILPREWGGVLGYYAWGIDPAMADNPDNNVYYAALHPDALTKNSLSVNTQGSVGEYNISGGLNFRNKFYMGFSLGIQDIYYRQYTYLTEEYDQSYDPDNRKVDYLEYDQYHRYVGTGVNFKFGMIFRPIEPLRLSMAVHTPTFVSLDSEYRGWMYTEAQPKSDGSVAQNSAQSNSLKSVYNYVSPTHLMLGTSYQIENLAILSLDYERVWYNGMRISSTDTEPVSNEVKSGYKTDIRNAFKGQDNLRFGMELRPMPELALRAGYAFSGSPVKDKAATTYTGARPIPLFDAPVANRTNSFSVGAGYRMGGFSIDAAYVFTKIDNTDHNPYWWDDGSPAPDRNIYSSAVNSSMKRNIVTLTAGFRF